MALTDTKIRSAKPAEKGYRLPDGAGLHLWVAPGGVKSWRWRYEADGKEQTLVLGRYPELSLSNARLARDNARRDLQAGRVPGVAREAVSLPTFRDTATRWHAMNKSRWRDHHAIDVWTSMEPALLELGDTPVAKVSSREVLTMLRKIEDRGAIEAARRLRQRISHIYAMAIGEEIAENDPAGSIVRALKPLPERGHQPAVGTIEEARLVLETVEAAAGQPATKLSHRLLALTAARPDMINGMVWTELHDLYGPAPEWRIPGRRMKQGRDHIIPLAPRAVETLTAAHRLTGDYPYVFPNLRNAHQPQSANALSYALARVGWRDKHVPHGWRATFSTVMNERYPADRAVIELMLAHVNKDAVERAYNRAVHLPRRRELAQLWADLLLEGVRPAADLLTGPRR